MLPIEQIKSNYRLQVTAIGNDGLLARLVHPTIKDGLVIIASWGGGWEHGGANLTRSSHSLR